MSAQPGAVVAGGSAHVGGAIVVNGLHLSRGGRPVLRGRLFIQGPHDR